MYPQTDFESEIRKCGGEPLVGSGFEDEEAEPGFEFDALPRGGR